MTGAFVVFEGGEGAGKSTQVLVLADALRARGLEVVRTREPGGTPIGEQIREVLLGAASHGMSHRTEALLFAAARAEHAAKVLRPARDRGAVVISDRYVDSSVAYQGVARGLGAKEIAALSDWATAGLLPDLTVVLDLDPAVGLARAGDPNRMEGEPAAFHGLVRAAFLEQAAAAPGRYLVLDGAAEPAEVASRVLASVVQILGSHSVLGGQPTDQPTDRPTDLPTAQHAGPANPDEPPVTVTQAQIGKVGSAAVLGTVPVRRRHAQPNGIAEVSPAEVGDVQ